MAPTFDLGVEVVFGCQSGKKKVPKAGVGAMPSNLFNLNLVLVKGNVLTACVDFFLLFTENVDTIKKLE